MPHEGSEMIAWAAEFSANRHAGQKRKYNGKAYITHTAAVARRVREFTSDSDVICAAYLHDTIEDTRTTYEELVENFNERIADFVLELTDTFTPEAYPDDNRFQRKKMECERLGTCSEEARLIKMCDINNNLDDLVLDDPKFAVVCLREMSDMVEAMATKTNSGLCDLVTVYNVG